MAKKEQTNDRHEDHDDVVTSARAGNTGHPPASPPPRPSGDVVARSRSSRDGHGADQPGFSCDAESAFRIVDGLAPPPLSESLARLLCLGAFARSTPTSTSTVRPPSPFFSFTPFFVAVSCSSSCGWVPRLHDLGCPPHLLLLSCG
jgi:hypothetical protein